MKNTFFEHTGPWLHITSSTQSQITDWALKMATRERSLVIRIVRGKKMRTAGRLFDECAAACQFPYYFGENWNAFSECIADLSWLPGGAYLLIVTDSLQVVREEPAEFATFVRLLRDAGREWGRSALEARPWAPEPRAFHTLFECERETLPRLRELLTMADVEYDETHDLAAF